MLVQEVGATSFEAQQMVLITDELKLLQSSEEFRGCINGCQVFLRTFLGVHSRLCITCKALTEEVDCIASTVVNTCLDDEV